MDLKRARYILKFCGDICEHVDCKKARCFIEGHAAATKAAEPLVEVIEKQTEILERIDKAAMVYAYKSPEEGFNEILVAFSASVHQRCMEALASSSLVVAAYRKTILGEEPTAKGREGI